MNRARALLDPDGVYQGVETVGKTFKPGKADVLVPPDCDLEPGKYRWTGDQFVPIKSTEPEDIVNERHTLVAIFAGFNAVEEAMPGTLPAVTKRWLDWYRKTFDAKGVAQAKE